MSFQYLVTPMARETTANKKIGTKTPSMKYDFINDEYAIFPASFLMLSRFRWPRACKDNNKDNGRHGKKEDKRTGIADHFSQKAWYGIVFNRQFSDCIKDFARFCTSRTVRSAVAALMAEPDIRIADEACPLSPTGHGSSLFLGNGLSSGVKLHTTEQVAHW